MRVDQPFRLLAGLAASGLSRAGMPHPLPPVHPLRSQSVVVTLMATKEELL